MDAWRVRAFILVGIATLLGCSGGGSAPASAPAAIPEAVTGPAWWGFGRDVQHTAQSSVATQPLSRIRWSAAVDMAPQLVDSDLLIHYGSPVITAKNTVLMPVKTGATDGFKVEVRSGASGALLWSSASDYILPEHGWTPSYNLSLTTNNRLYMPGAGGKVLFRVDPDAPLAASGNKVFFGSEIYLTSPALFDASIFINTPLTIDSEANLFFGFIATAANPAGLVSGIARIGANGVGRWIAASATAADRTIAKMAMNSAPALSSDQRTLYVAVNTAAIPGIRQSGYLLALDSTTLAPKAAQRLNDPKTGRPAWIDDNASSSPTVGRGHGDQPVHRAYPP